MQRPTHSTITTGIEGKVPKGIPNTSIELPKKLLNTGVDGLTSTTFKVGKLDDFNGSISRSADELR
jgi:hypothetical protein